MSKDGPVIKNSNNMSLGNIAEAHAKAFTLDMEGCMADAFAGRRCWSSVWPYARTQAEALNLRRHIGSAGIDRAFNEALKAAADHHRCVDDSGKM